MLFDWTVLDTGGGGEGSGGGKMRPARKTSFASSRHQLVQQLKANIDELELVDKVIAQYPADVKPALKQRAADLRAEIDERQKVLADLRTPFYKQGRAERNMLETGLRYDLSNGVYLTAKTIGPGHSEFESIHNGLHPAWGFLLRKEVCTGISQSYIRGLQQDSDQVAMVVVTYRHFRESREIVNVVVCTETTRPAEEPRLYNDLVCNKPARSEGAMAVAMETLLVAAKEAKTADGDPIEGICLSAASFALVPTYQRYGFEVTTDASKPFDVDAYADHFRSENRVRKEQATRISEFLQVFQIVSLAALKKSVLDARGYDSFKESLIDMADAYFEKATGKSSWSALTNCYMDLSFKEKRPPSPEEQENIERIEAFATEMLTTPSDPGIFLHEFETFLLQSPPPPPLSPPPPPLSPPPPPASPLRLLSPLRPPSSPPALWELPIGEMTQDEFIRAVESLPAASKNEPDPKFDNQSGSLVLPPLNFGHAGGVRNPGPGV